MSMTYGMLVAKRTAARAAARGSWSKMMEWGAEFGREIAIAVKKHVANETQPLRDRINALETETKFLKESGVNFRGPFQDGESYAAGDVVQRGGSLWRCYSPTTKQPPNDGWRLLVKKGRDGKDAAA
jgi:hypothetical protein